MNAQKKVIVWDWNGTLIEDLHANVECLNITLQRFNKPLVDVRRYQETFEIPIGNMYCRLGFTKEEHAANAALIQEMFHENYEKHVQNVGFRSQARALLESTLGGGAEHVILSNHIVSSITDHLARLNATSLFSTVLAHDDTRTQRKWQPKGDRLKSFMHERNVQAKDCVIVGDTAEETEIARQLGLTSVAITGGFATEEKLRKAAPDYIINSYTEFPDFGQLYGEAA